MLEIDGNIQFDFVIFSHLIKIIVTTEKKVLKYLPKL